MDSICKLSEIDLYSATHPHWRSPGRQLTGTWQLNTTEKTKENLIVERHDRGSVVSEHLGTRRIPKCIHILACLRFRPHDVMLPQLRATILAEISFSARRAKLAH